MNPTKTRRQITWEAARMMYFREESEYYRAKMKAARRICRGWVKPSDLPSNGEIRDEIQLFARTHEGTSRENNLCEMRLQAYWLMRVLEQFHPRLIGSVLTGHVRAGSDIDIHLFSDSLYAITRQLDDEGLIHAVEKKRVRKDGTETTYTHIHVQSEFAFELTVYPRNRMSYGFRCSITGKPIEKVSLAELRLKLNEVYADLDLDQEWERLNSRPDRFQYFASLLYPLERVMQNPVYHPEGDALYHSLQVFDLACNVHPYDEEFLIAALLHDIGKAIDPEDHVSAALEALDGFITERTKWLIEHHMDCHRIHDRSIGARAHRRLKSNEDYQELLDLGEADRAGRCCGISTSSVEEALEVIESLNARFN